MSHPSVDAALVPSGWPVPQASRVLRSPVNLERQLHSVWTHLEPNCDSPFRTLGWMTAGASAFASGRRLRVLVSEDADRAAILPLVLRFDRGPRLEILGSREMFEPIDGTYAGRPGAEALAEMLLRQRLPIVLSRLPEDSALVQAVRTSGAPGRVEVLPAPGSPTLDLDGVSADPEAQMSARRRADLRRARRLAEAIGPVEIDILDPTPAALPLLLDEAFAVEAAGWKGRAGTALLLDQARGAFYRRFCEHASEMGILRLAFLRIGGVPAAMQLLVQYAQRLWLLKIGYDPAFARCSPGLQLMAATLRHAVACGLASYELLGVDEPWLRPWNPVLRPCVTVRVHPAGPIGRLARLAYHLIP